jgi:hypothetical protein
MYPYLDVVVGMTWSNYPASNAGVKVATGSASRAGLVTRADPDYKGYLGSPGSGLGVGLTTQRR